MNPNWVYRYGCDAGCAYGEPCCDSCCYKWAPLIDLQLKEGSRTLAGANVMIPLMQDDRSLLLLDTRGWIDGDGWYANNGSEESNIGLVYRQQIDCHYILGTYLYYDQKTSEFDNEFEGVAWGAELHSQHFDARWKHRRLQKTYP